MVYDIQKGVRWGGDIALWLCNSIALGGFAGVGEGQ